MTYNPHQEGGNRKPSRLRFFLRLVLTLTVCGYCVFLNFRRCGVVAHAETNRLTPGQTLALYGMHIPAVYYNADSHHQVQVTFDYVGLSTDFVPSGSDSPFFYFSLNDAGQANSALLSLESGKAAFLRYRCTDLLYRDPMIGGTDDNYFVSSGASAITQYNFTFTPSVNFDAVDVFEQVVLCPVRADINRTEPSRFSNRVGQFTILGNFGYRTGNMVYESNGDIPYFVVPFYKPNNNLDFRTSSYSAPYSDTTICMAAYSLRDNQPILPSNGNITGFNFLWNWAGAFVEDLPLGTPLSVEIWVQCPQISGGFVPPVITTAPTTTTAPQTTRPPYSGEPYVTTPLYTYNLLPIESNQQVQIDIMNENLQYNAGTFDGINIIIKQLDDIYNAMKASGELTVEQIAGLEWSIGTDVREFVQNHITYTVASMNWQDVYRPVTGFYNLLDQYTFLDSFAVLGGVALAFGVFCWFIFRGRGG